MTLSKSNTKPRVLHVGKYYPPFAGGIENFMVDLLPTQIAHGHAIAAVVHDHNIALKRSFTRVQAESHNPTLYRVPSYGRLLYAPISPQFPWWLQRSIQQFQPDILHLHMPNTSALWALLLPAARRLPWVIHWHADVVSVMHQQLALAYRVYRPFEQRLLAHAAAVIITSAPYLATSPALQAWQDKCEVIPLGIAPTRLPAVEPDVLTWARQQWSKPQHLKVLSIGRLTYYKGHEVLIQAVQQYPDLDVCIVGKGEEKARLQQLIERLQLQSRVHLLGYCDTPQLLGLLNACDVFCLPSLERSEAFGVVLLEAMRYGKPLVASNITGSGVTWVVRDQYNGVLFPPNDATALAQVLHDLHLNATWRQQLGTQGQQRFVDEFDITAVSEAISDLYQRV